MPDEKRHRRGVLFDVDGTLVDTTYLHTVCWAEALRQHGFEVTSADVHHSIGMSGEQLLAEVLGEDHTPKLDDAISGTHDALYKLGWGRLPTLPRAADLLRECARRGLVVVLASSASDQELQVLRRTLDADDVIAHATSKDDAGAGKPEPDIVQAALDGGHLDAKHAVFVGDAIWDGAAADKAGVVFLGLTCGGTPEADLRAAGAAEVWRDPADLLAHVHDSVLGRL